MQNEVSIYEPVGTDREGNEISLIDIMECDSEPVCDKVELKLQVGWLYHKMKSILKNREKKILDLRYGLAGCEELTQKEIARKMGISRSYVSRIEKKAVQKLACEIEK